MGVSLVVENICRFFFGNAARSFDVTLARPIRWQGVRINHEQIVTASVVIVALILVHLLLTASPLGRAMRAVADNPALAAVRGVERRTVARIAWALTGALLGAVAGALMIGIAEEMSALILPTNYRQVVSFCVILLLLLFRTNGLFGAKAVRK
jgi:branched-chain amino acid transport system permease protein